jgi:hypothetical protein
MDDRNRCGRDFDVPLAAARISAGVMTTTVMTAVVVFVVTLLLASKGVKSVPADAPLIVLFAAALGFLFGTLVYANSYVEIRRRCERRFDRQMHTANVISELFGVYGLIVAIPLAVAAVTAQWPVRIGVAVLTLIALVAYDRSPYSLLDQHRREDKLHPERRAPHLSMLVVALILGTTDFVLMTAGSSVWLQASIAALFILLTARLAADGLKNPPARVAPRDTCPQCPNFVE